MKVPDNVYVLGHSYTCYTYSCYAYHFYAYRLYFINVWHAYECNSMRVYHATIITWATADTFVHCFPTPPHNPRSHTCDYVTHVTVNGSGVTSRKVRYGSRDFKVTRKMPAVRHIHVKIFKNILERLLHPTSSYFLNALCTNYCDAGTLPCSTQQLWPFHCVSVILSEFQKLNLPPMSLPRHVIWTLPLVRSIHRIRNTPHFGEGLWLRSNDIKAGGLPTWTI
jgi:hypothetical protein